jgi:glycosyltransferase involved in cell wall biosynthesis
MTILVVNWQDWNNPNSGGAELNLREIFSRLVKKGHRVILLCSRAAGQRRHEVLDGFEIYRIGKRNNFNFYVPAAMRSVLRHNAIHVVVDDLNKIPFYSHAFTRKPVIGLMHHLFRSAIYRETNPFFATYVFFAERVIPVCYRHTPFVAVSQSTANDLRGMGVQGCIDIVHNGIPVRPHDLDVSRDKNLVAYVGRVKKYKSIEHFVEVVAAIQKQRNIKAIIVGDGDAREGLMRRADELEAHITFAGFVSEREKFSVYSQARVVVQPSVKEGWGLTVIEAQSCGTPVVCADSPGLREAVVSGRTGYHYPYGDIEALRARIVDLLDDDATWNQFSQEAEKWAQNFSWDVSAEKFEAILKRAV